MPRRIFFQEWFPFRVTEFYKIYIYCLQWLAISDKRPRFILVKNVFRIVHSRMCKHTRFGLFTFSGQWKSWHNSIFEHKIDDTGVNFIWITFLSQFCLFNTLFQVYPTTARMKNFAGLVKRHLAEIFCGYRPLTAWF
jgi:hypothetical protein